jgi:hypothetical protein
LPYYASQHHTTLGVAMLDKDMLNIGGDSGRMNPLLSIFLSLLLDSGVVGQICCVAV